MRFYDAAHMGVQQMGGQRCGGRPRGSDGKDWIKIPLLGLGDPGEVGGGVALDGQAGQVGAHAADQAEVVERLAGQFQARVAPQVLVVRAVWQVQQGCAGDLFLDEGDP